MIALETAVRNALQTSGATPEANKAYLEFIKANFIIPVEHYSEDAHVLFLHDNGMNFLPVFSARHYLDDWAQEIKNDIDILQLSGVDLLKGIEDGVTVCLNIGTSFYKEFNPAEIARMRSMILKLFKN